MAVDPEHVVDHTVDRGELLGIGRRFDAAHLAIPLPGDQLSMPPQEGVGRNTCLGITQYPPTRGPWLSRPGDGAGRR